MDLINYDTNETIRTATIDEAIESIKAGRLDNGCGVIKVDGISCYVDATEEQVADELRALEHDDAETFARVVAQ